LKKILFIFTLITVSLFAKVNATQKHILVLHSYNKSMSWITNIDKAIVDTLKPNQNNYILHIEYMDTKRIFTPKYLEQLKQLYKNKYKNMKLDLILSSDNNAFNFLRKNRDEIFGDIPTSFCGVNFFKDRDIDKLSNYTGATEEFDAKKTIQAAIKLYPKAKKIFVINDYLTTGRAWDKSIKEQLKSINKNIIYSKNQTIEELKNRLKTLSKDTIVLLGVYFKDKDDKFFTYEKIGEMIATSSNAPVFCLLEFNLKKGVVGGSVIGGYYQGVAMSKIAKQILSGVKVSKLAVQKRGTTKFVFDYNGLVKYNMNIKNIPQNAIILNKPVSYFDKHKNIILVSVVVIIILFVVIMQLLISAKKEKESKKLLKISKKEIDDLNNTLELKVKEKTKEFDTKNQELQQYLNVIDDIEIGLFIVDADFKIRYMNNTMIKWFGDQTNTVCYKSVAGLDDPCPYCKIKDVIELGKKVRYTPSTPDGQSFDIMSAPIHNIDGTISKMEVIRNVTKQKRLEDKFFKSEKLSSMGEMIGNIAHQWRQPLSIIAMNMNNILADLDLDEVDDKNLKKYANGSIKQIEYLSKTIDDFKNFIKGDRTKEIFNLSSNIDGFLHLVNGTAKNNNINIILNLQEDIKIDGYKNELIQCFINIFNNAKDILKEKNITKKLIFISTESINNKAIIKIKDNAGGIQSEILPKIFEPYFTTKHKSQGTGLGLHMTYNLIVDGMDGTIEALNQTYTYEDEKYTGAEFIITLPM